MIKLTSRSLFLSLSLRPDDDGGKKRSSLFYLSLNEEQECGEAKTSEDPTGALLRGQTWVLDANSDAGKVFLLLQTNHIISQCYSYESHTLVNQSL